MNRFTATYTMLATLAAIALLVTPSVLNAQDSGPRNKRSKVMGPAIEYALNATEEDFSGRPVRLLPTGIQGEIDYSETTALAQDERALTTELSEEVGIPTTTWQETVQCTNTDTPREVLPPKCAFKDDAVLISAYIVRSGTSRARVETRLRHSFKGKIVRETRELLLERKEGAWMVAEQVGFSIAN